MKVYVVSQTIYKFKVYENLEDANEVVQISNALREDFDTPRLFCYESEVIA
jgi:hypothetical protein